MDYKTILTFPPSVRWPNVLLMRLQCSSASLQPRVCMGNVADMGLAINIFLGDSYFLLVSVMQVCWNWGESGSSEILYCYCNWHLLFLLGLALSLLLSVVIYHYHCHCYGYTTPFLCFTLHCLFRKQHCTFSECSIFAGYRGWACTDKSQAMANWQLILATLLLTLSNLFFLPAIILALKRRYFAEAVVYAFTMVFSTVIYF